jgi:hypothetical protein
VPANAVQPVQADDNKPIKKQTQKVWTSKFYCATEEGDIIYSDWIAPEKATEEKGN